MEIYKDIQNYEGYYQVSNLGNIKSLSRKVVSKGGFRTLNSRILSQKNVNGYRMVNLAKEGVTINFFVHRLVGLAFIPNPDNKPQINHKDGVKSNNNVNNLEWCTNSENSIHKNQLNPHIKYDRSGEKGSNSKLNSSKVAQIREKFNSGISFKELSEQYNITRSNIYYIVNNKTWKNE